MEEENEGANTPPPDDFLNRYAPKPKEPGNGMRIVGYNLVVLAAYSLVCLTMSGGFILDAIALLLHVLICFGLAIDRRSWFWALSGLLVLIIGFSSCAYLGSMH